MKGPIKCAAWALLALSFTGCSRSNRLAEVPSNAGANKSDHGSAAPKEAAFEDPQPSPRRLVAGTPFALSVPAGFRPATRFDGFSGPDESTMIMITALPVPPDKLSGMWQPDKLRAQGMSLVKKERVSVSGITAELAFVTHSVEGMEFEKWILVFPTQEQTFLCVAAYPSAESDALRLQLRDSLLSISYDAAAIAASAPTFHVDVAGLKLAHRISRTEMYTADGKPEQASPGAPLFLAGPSIAKVAPVDRHAYFQQRLRQTAHTTILEVTPPAALVVDGLPGFESVATATDTSSGTPMTVYHLMLFAEDHYFIIQGLVGREQAAVYLERFKQAARSFRRQAPHD